MSLDERDAPGFVYRVAHEPDAWDWPDWTYVGSNRWDDPLNEYRVLYASTSLLGCFVEVLARFRPDSTVIAGLEEIEENDDDALPKSAPAGVLRPSWADGRLVGTAELVEGLFADVCAAGSMGWLHREMAADLVHFGYYEMDAAVLRFKTPRAFTQRVSRRVYAASTDAGGLFAGIYYRSRLGDDLDNYAMFSGDRWRAENPAAAPVNLEAPELRRALEILGVRIEQ